MSYFLEPRSDNDYGECEDNGAPSSPGCSAVFSFPLAFVGILFIRLLPVLALVVYFIADVGSTLKRTIQSGKLAYPFLAHAGAVLAFGLMMANGDPFNKPIRLKSEVAMLAIGFILVFTVLPYLALGLNRLLRFHAAMTTKYAGTRAYGRYLIVAAILLGAVVLFSIWLPSSSTPTPPTETAPAAQVLRPSLPTQSAPTTEIKTVRPSETSQAISILVDDFRPQPYQDESVYFFNRLDGDRGAINNSVMDWGPDLVTTTISAGNSWGGAWLSLNHPIREGLPIDFSAVLPAQILPAFQSQITGLMVHIARGTPQAAFRLELKYHGHMQWQHEIELTGRDQTIGLDLPPLGQVNELVWVLDRAAAGDHIVLESISFTATTSITDTAMAAFVWSYGQLLNNWNPATGLVRDKAKDASNEFDAIQATGSLAAATASAEQLGVIDHTAAIAIVDRIERALLNLPRWHGLWPHWVTTAPTGESTIVFGTEWSSVDTVIAALGLLDAQSALGLNTTATEQIFQSIDWADLVTPGGLSHGYAYAGERLPYAWDVFGGESWLVELAYAGVTGQVTALAYPTPPTANGSGFIDELAWLFVPPPDRSDYWGTDWTTYRRSAAAAQLAYYSETHPIDCAGQLGLFGLSAAEVPVPASVPPTNIYQAFGAGGRFAAANDGTAQSGGPVIAPHYAALIASLDPQAAVRLWSWLIAQGYFTPLTNVESILLPTSTACHDTPHQWNSLKGSWNLALQTLGWGRYLVEQRGLVPSTWQAVQTNALLQRGYGLLVPGWTSPALTSPPASDSTTPFSCEGKPYKHWGAPGTYVYRRDGGSSFTVTLKAGDSVPNLGVNGPAPLSVAGEQDVTIALGTFRATVLNASRDYDIVTGRLDRIKGHYERTEWYICGYGLIKLMSFDSTVKTPGNAVHSNTSNWALLSYTPPLPD